MKLDQGFKASLNYVSELQTVSKRKRKKRRKKNKKHNQKTENQPLCLLMELIRRKQNLKP